MVTDWRTKLQREMNELDNRAIGRAVDRCSTTRRSNISAPRSARRSATARRSPAYADAAVKNETSLAWLNIGQSLITNVMMAGRDGLHRLGLEPGRASPPATWCWSTPCCPAVPAARHARLGLSHDPPGPDRHGGDVRPDRHAGRGRRRARRARARGRAPATSASRTSVSATSPTREILKGVDLEVPAGHARLAVVGPSGAGKSTLVAAAVPLLRPDRRGGSRSTARTSPRSPRRACARRSASSRRTRCCSTTRSATISATAATARRQEEIEAAAARRGDPRLHRDRCPHGYRIDGRRARAQAVGRREAARRHRPHPAQGPADPDPRRGDQRARQPHRGGDPGDARRRRRAPHHASSSPTACRPWSTPTRSSCSTRAGSPSAAPTPNCCARTASTPTCGRASRASARSRKRSQG